MSTVHPRVPWWFSHSMTDWTRLTQWLRSTDSDYTSAREWGVEWRRGRVTFWCWWGCSPLRSYQKQSHMSSMSRLPKHNEPQLWHQKSETQIQVCDAAQDSKWFSKNSLAKDPAQLKHLQADVQRASMADRLPQFSQSVFTGCTSLNIFWKTALTNPWNAELHTHTHTH